MFDGVDMEFKVDSLGKSLSSTLRILSLGSFNKD